MIQLPRVLAHILEAPCLLAPDPKSHTLPAKPGSSAKHERTLPIPGPHLVSQLTWVLSPGESTTTVSPFVPGGVSDGQWHTVQLKYYNKVSVGGLGGCPWPGCSPTLGDAAFRGGKGWVLATVQRISIPLGSARYVLFP